MAFNAEKLLEPSYRLMIEHPEFPREPLDWPYKISQITKSHDAWGYVEHSNEKFYLSIWTRDGEITCYFGENKNPMNPIIKTNDPVEMAQALSRALANFC
jgi:hypothetical protein